VSQPSQSVRYQTSPVTSVLEDDASQGQNRYEHHLKLNKSIAKFYHKYLPLIRVTKSRLTDLKIQFGQFPTPSSFSKAGNLLKFYLNKKRNFTRSIVCAIANLILSFDLNHLRLKIEKTETAHKTSCGKIFRKDEKRTNKNHQILGSASQQFLRLTNTFLLQNLGA
jgi:hypothetical protein